MHVQKRIIAQLQKQTHEFFFLLSFFAAYDSLAEKARKQISAWDLCRVCQGLA